MASTQVVGGAMDDVDSVSSLVAFAAPFAAVVVDDDDDDVSSDFSRSLENLRSCSQTWLA
jgi:hypothetical protein